MQSLVNTLFFALLTIVPAFCWPVYNDQDENNEYDNSLDLRKVETELDKIFANELKDLADIKPRVQEDIHEFEDKLNDIMSNNSYNDHEPQLAGETLKELNKQLASRDRGQQALSQATSSGRVLEQGCTIALQLMQNNYWLSCFENNYCNGATCPGIFFDGSDWNNCESEVFQIYHASGRGDIVNGDLVGLYYVNEQKWFSMYDDKGNKQTCPGLPNIDYGFHLEDSWRYCGAEVFQIYAKGKYLGESITDQDTISLYYPVGEANVLFLPNEVTLSTCMLERSSHLNPPTDIAFDQCIYESVEITID